MLMELSLMCPDCGNDKWKRVMFNSFHTLYECCACGCSMSEVHVETN